MAVLQYCFDRAPYGGTGSLVIPVEDMPDKHASSLRMRTRYAETYYGYDSRKVLHALDEFFLVFSDIDNTINSTFSYIRNMVRAGLRVEYYPDFNNDSDDHMPVMLQFGDKSFDFSEEQNELYSFKLRVTEAPSPLD